MTVSTGLQYLIEEFQRAAQGLEPKRSGQTISVDTVAARVASFYEKLRGVVDWREEHLLRKTAIERMLKRRMLLNKNGKEMAEPLLQELVRGGHFPNNSIPTERIEDIQNIIDKHASLMNAVGMDDWLLSIAAAEIEEILAYPRKELALIDFMSRDMQERIQPEGYNEHISVAVRKALFKLDNPTITYHLLSRFYPDWGSDPQHLKATREHIEQILASPITEKIYLFAERHDTSYLILSDILEENPNAFSEASDDSINIEGEIKAAYDTRRNRLQGKIRRAAIYSIASIFITKIFIARLVEVPVDQYFGLSLDYTAMAINVLFPPLFLLVFVLSAKTSSAENFQRVLMEVMKIAKGTQSQDTYDISPPRKKRTTLRAIAYMMYLLSFLVSFGVIVWILQKLHFSVFSIAIFLLFISLVAFAGTKIRQRARELMIGEEKEGFLHGLFDFFSLPIVQVGKWLSGKIARYNILVLFLTFLIEIPFQIFVEFIDQWRSFLKEQKEKIH